MAFLWVEEEARRVRVRMERVGAWEGPGRRRAVKGSREVPPAWAPFVPASFAGSLPWPFVEEEFMQGRVFSHGATLRGLGLGNGFLDKTLKSQATTSKNKEFRKSKNMCCTLADLA